MLRQIAYRDLGHGRFFALYGLTPETAGPEAWTDSLVGVLDRYVRARPGQARALTYAATQLIHIYRPEEALIQLRAAESLDPGDPEVAELEAFALLILERYGEAASAAERALRSGPTAWRRVVLGMIRNRQGRGVEARDLLIAAVGMEPANAGYRIMLGMTRLSLREYAAAAADLQQGLRLVPERMDARMAAARALAFSGRPGRAIEILQDGRRSGGLPIPLQALEDSIRAGLGFSEGKSE